MSEKIDIYASDHPEDITQKFITALKKIGIKVESVPCKESDGHMCYEISDQNENYLDDDHEDFRDTFGKINDRLTEIQNRTKPPCCKITGSHGIFTIHDPVIKE